MIGQVAISVKRDYPLGTMTWHSCLQLLRILALSWSNQKINKHCHHSPPLFYRTGQGVSNNNTVCIHMYSSSTAVFMEIQLSLFEIPCYGQKCQSRGNVDCMVVLNEAQVMIVKWNYPLGIMDIHTKYHSMVAYS